MIGPSCSPLLSIGFYPTQRWLWKTTALLLLFCFLLFGNASPLLAQTQTDATTSAAPPIYWYLIAAAFSMLVPAGVILVSLAGLDVRQARDTALGGVGAMGIAALAYWAIGFALQFGGVGLVYPNPDLRSLVWEWSPLASDWGVGWGVAGISGWFLSGAAIPALVYALFLAHLPWAMSAALLPVAALRGRAPAPLTLLLSLVMAGIVYPLAGNWLQGGGWLSALGRNMGLGHGTVDFSGAASVHLLAAGFSLAALAVWTPIRIRQKQQGAFSNDESLPAAEMPLLAVLGSLLLLAGAIGWQWSNPLQITNLNDPTLLRGALNIVLCAASGVIAPLLYTWFVTGASEPMMSSRGVAAGVVAGLACAPFLQPGGAFLVGLLAGLSVPFVTYIADRVLSLDDATGVLCISGAPAMLGLLLIGILADGVAGQGWQMTGLQNYLGVTGQGVSGLFVASGYQVDFPGQLQAQLIGVLAVGLWGFVAGLAVCTPLGLLTHSLSQQRSRRGFELEHSAPNTRVPEYQMTESSPPPLRPSLSSTPSEPAPTTPSIRPAVNPLRPRSTPRE
jgi:Amt family ammonium transporter